MPSELWIPKALKRPLPINSDRDPIIVPIGAVFHIAVSNADSLHDQFRRRTDGIESTGYIRFDGTIEQYRPLNVECDAQGDGNSFAWNGRRGGFTSWETAGGVPDGRGEWTAEQIKSIKTIITHHHAKLDPSVPLRQAPTWNSSGFGYHRLFKEWNKNGHSCPGNARVEQWNDIIVPWLKAGSHLWRPEVKMNNVQKYREAVEPHLKGLTKAAKDHPIPTARIEAHKMQEEIEEHKLAIRHLLMEGPKA